ncbi:MAG: hypothetical protein QOH19_1214, partial [Actinomycetota bacterium]|nr:hypothetical protein [Actinomycetota bacterium]
MSGVLSVAECDSGQRERDVVHCYEQPLGALNVEGDSVMGFGVMDRRGF